MARSLTQSVIFSLFAMSVSFVALKRTESANDPKPEEMDATEQAKEMEDVQEDAAKEREENGGYQ
jgi:hypothetical protein